MTPVVSVILVNWNAGELAHAAIASLQLHETTLPLEIILVDNASTDGSADYLERLHPDVRLIRNSRNEGFARANNIGVKAATGEYVLLLNTDTVFSESVLPACLAVAREQAPAIVACRLLNADGSLQASADRFPRLRNLFLEIFGDSASAGAKTLRRLEGIAQPSPVDWICGAFLLVEHETYARLGGLDESIFMYGEDVELCWRALGAGVRCWYVPSARLVHLGGGTVNHASARAVLLSDRGRLRAMELMRGRRAAGVLRAIFCARSAMRAAAFALAGTARRDPALRKRARIHVEALAALLRRGP
ncbi:MAG: putative glycosyltransferase [Fibrobacteria bacterium]|jgi:GT2 family glycosyltransferase|nr:putative glycosyltransferase [Fibrobacteria bacterium]